MEPIIKDFYIELDKQYSTYEPGEVVTGTVHLDLNKRIICDQVCAQFYGSARVFWVERELKPLTLAEEEDADGQDIIDRMIAEGIQVPKVKTWGKTLAPAAELRHVPYSQEKIYFDERHVLWDRENRANRDIRSEPGSPAHGCSIDELVRRSSGLRINPTAVLSKEAACSNRPYLENGKHTFKFKFTLPEALQTSFDSETTIGSVRYFVKAIICEWNQTKHSRKQLFTVVNPYDLNNTPSLALPKSQTCRKQLKSGLVKSKCGDITAKVTLLKSGYTSGEQFMFAAEIKNDGNESVKGVQLQLVRRTVCHALVTKVCHKVVCSQSYKGKVGKNGGQIKFQPTLYVPVLTPSFVEADILEVDYSLLLLVSKRLEGKKALLRVELPIVIGTVPLRIMDTQLNTPNVHPPTYEATFGIPPPSYDESTSDLLTFDNDAYQHQSEERPPDYPALAVLDALNEQEQPATSSTSVVH